MIKIINFIKSKLFPKFKLPEIKLIDSRKVYQFNGSISHGSGEVTSVVVFVRIIDYKNQKIESKAITHYSHLTGKDDPYYTWDWSEETWQYENLPIEIKREIKLDQINNNQI
jgi:hypothetical protein